MSLRSVSTSDLAALDPLIERFEFKPYRNYRVFPRKTQDAVMRADVAATLDHPDGLVLRAESDGGHAAIVGRTLPWDSSFFGVPMARIDYVMADGAELAAKLLEGALESFRSRGVRLISARADVADVATVGLLEAHGFRLMDSLVTYITRPRKEPPNPVREVGTIRAFRAGDAAELVSITEEAYRGFRGRFHLDPHIPAARADDFYVEWARQCVSGKMADMLLVSEAPDGQLLGYLAFRRREPVSSVAKTPVFGGGLGACRVDAPGAYAGLIRAGTIWAHEHDGVAECQTQNYNFPVIRIYEAVGSHYVRGEYTLHAWLA